MRRGWRSIAPITAALGAALSAAACEFDATDVDRSTPLPVVHAVLNPGANDYVVLVEELLSGRVTLDEDVPFDVNDPIRTGMGVPVSGAIVRISDDDGNQATGVEGANLTGVYHFSNGGTHSAALALVPGQRYHLHITTPRGDVVTGVTTIPTHTESPVLEGISPFNRETDTVRLQWPAVPTAKRIMVRVESPFGPFALFVQDSPMALPGNLRSFFRIELPPVFVPGFTQQVLVSAVDSNVYDYYRSGNDPFTGRGIINRLSGGIGLFGALVPLSAVAVDVTATIDKPFEGEFRLVEQSATAPPRIILYEVARTGPVIQLSGRYVRDAGLDQLPIIGTLNGSRITLALLRTTTLADTALTLRGTFAGDSLDVIATPQLERLVYRKPQP